MDCKKTRYYISLYLDRRLSERKLFKLKEHIRKCSKCMKVLEQGQSLKKAISEIPEPSLPPDLLEETSRVLNRRMKESYIKPLVNWNYVLRGTAVTIIVVGIFVSLKLWKANKNTEEMKPVVVKEIQGIGEKKEQVEIYVKESEVKSEKKTSMVKVKKQRLANEISEAEIIKQETEKLPETKQVTEGIIEEYEKKETIPTEVVKLNERNNPGISLGYAFGNGYNSVIISALYKNPKYFDFGFDGYILGYNLFQTVTSNYLGFVYVGSNLYEKGKLNIDCSIGVTLARVVYETISFNLSETIGIGVIAEYQLSSKWIGKCKILSVIYSDGISLPYQIGPIFSYNKLSIFMGLQGIITTNMNLTNITSNEGVSITLNYIF